MLILFWGLKVIYLPIGHIQVYINYILVFKRVYKKKVTFKYRVIKMTDIRRKTSTKGFVFFPHSLQLTFIWSGVYCIGSFVPL